MELKLLERLLDAGFTRDEIIRLARDEPAAAAPDQKGSVTDEGQAETGIQELSGTQEQSQTENVGESAEESGSEAKPAVDKGTDFENRLAGIEKTMENLTKAIQAGNLRNDSFPNPVETLEEKTDQVMMNIIRPVRRERAI